MTIDLLPTFLVTQGRKLAFQVPLIGSLMNSIVGRYNDSKDQRLDQTAIKCFEKNYFLTPVQ
jgi:hypothetical protein